jgi:predicted DsbA family dithiol-disulfide isomerase
MKKLEVFFDYTCPYCVSGHESLLRLLPKYPGTEPVWRSCEAHPRPERYGAHSDLLARGMYYVLERGGDVMKYHEIMYRAARDRADIENPRTVAELAGALADSADFYAALEKGAYLERLAENNRLAWGELRFPAVPSYRCNGKLLKSVENVGVSMRALEDFIRLF